MFQKRKEEKCAKWRKVVLRTFLRQSPKRMKTIHQKSKWTYFAGLLGCSTWQEVSACGTEGIRREMYKKKKKNPSFLLVNCRKKVWKKITKNSKSVLFPRAFTFFIFAVWQRWNTASLSWFAWKIEPRPTGEEGVRDWDKSLTLTKTRLTHVIRGKSGFREKKIVKKTVRLGNG